MAERKEEEWKGEQLCVLIIQKAKANKNSRETWVKNFDIWINRRKFLNEEKFFSQLNFSDNFRKLSVNFASLFSCLCPDCKPKVAFYTRFLSDENIICFNLILNQNLLITTLDIELLSIQKLQDSHWTTFSGKYDLITYVARIKRAIKKFSAHFVTLHPINRIQKCKENVQTFNVSFQIKCLDKVFLCESKILSFLEFLSWDF